ncbi:hypothetical protein ACJMK2_000029, partial [Sinanodonta woodiana]
TGIPVEILNMDDRSIQLFENALKDGKEKVYSIRVMVVGHLGVGKTTLIKRLLGKDVNILERQSTEGIDVHLNCCDVSLSSHEWILQKKESEQEYRLQRLAKVLIEKQVRSEAADEKQDVSSHEGEITDISTQDLDAEEPNIVSPHPDLQKTGQQVLSKTADEKQVVIPQEGDVADISGQDHVAEEPDLVSPHPDLLKTSQQVGSPGELRSLPKSNANTVVRSDPGKNVSIESRMKDPNREILQLLQKNADKIKHDLGKYAPLTMWDFAGQYAFYTTHQMFLSRRAIYLLVTDLSGQIDDMVDDEFYFDEKGKRECRVLELVEVWMNSVHSCAPPDNEIKNSEFIPPPVILVGTHADAVKQARKKEQMTLVQDPVSSPAHSKKQPSLIQRIRDFFTKKDYRHEICENYFREIRSHLKDKPSRFHLVEEDFAIDNTVVDRKLESLKRKIVEVASRQAYWGEEIPARWLPLEQVLMNLRAQGHKVIHRSQLENINQAGGVQISTDELDLFLRFQHEIGTILYFSTESLKEKIVLEPQWMINALKSLITVEEMFVLRHAPSVSTMWHEFRNGKLYLELIDALWTKDRNPDLHDNKDHLLLLMEQLNIIAKPTLCIDDESEIKEMNYFFAPCMLHVEPPRDVIFPEPHEQIESSSVMCYVFTGKFLPAPIFHRLLAACIARWPLATKKMKTTLENQIFCGCGVFRIGHLHKLTLYFSGYIISMRVTRQGTKDKTPSSKLCIEVKEFIAKVLNKVIGYLGHSLKFEEFIQCPEYKGEIVECRIPVALLKENDEVCCDSHDKLIESNKILKFWFDDESDPILLVNNTDGQDEDDVDAPITQEHINHARLCNALTTVCSNALREILLTNAPMPHTDIYKAILANEARLKKQLNKDQVKLVFPDPQGLTTGKVEEFDTSLLYTIIRNVSSVPAPSNGWGKPPNNNPRDTTLGASVERIRIYRNHISGHSVDGKISQPDFEDYWAEIDEVLREIEIVIGNHGYLEDLEKRKNQVITPHEAPAASDILLTLEDIESTLDTTRQALDKAKSDIPLPTNEPQTTDMCLMMLCASKFYLMMLCTSSCQMCSMLCLMPLQS